MSDPITVRLSNAVKSHLESKSEINQTSMSEEARRALESTVTPEHLAEVYLSSKYGPMRVENWLANRPQWDVQPAIGAISSLRTSNIDPVLKKAIVKRLSHYLPLCAQFVSATLPEGETPDWRYGGGKYEDKMMALRSAYVSIYGEPEREPDYWEDFVEALIDNDVKHAFSLTR